MEYFLYICGMKAVITYTLNNTPSDIEFEGNSKSLLRFIREIEGLKNCKVNQVSLS